jgi:hypothetical protein
MRTPIISFGLVIVVRKKLPHTFKTRGSPHTMRTPIKSLIFEVEFVFICSRLNFLSFFVSLLLRPFDEPLVESHFLKHSFS